MTIAPIDDRSTPIRDLLHDRITDVIAAFDAHDPGIYEGQYLCACKWKGTEQQWETHLAEAIADVLCVQTVELPALFEAIP